MCTGCERSTSGLITWLHRAPVLGARVLILTMALGFAHSAVCKAATVTYAGFAYAGNAENIGSRFKYSKRYEARLKSQGTTLDTKLRQAVQGGHFPFDLNMTGNTEIKGDETLVTTLTVTGETVSDEIFGPVHKLLVQIRDRP